ncbi:MAG TPA: hypothetical protein VK850_10680 [Candidatus Binatia bacterium]|nr:hypothetical protein [Candidatus Binatia bacterium]
MSIIVQHLTSRLYSGSKGEWKKLAAGAARFENALAAISFCIQHGIRSVRLVHNPGTESERYFYPFGEDPGIKAEKKKLRRALVESRRQQQRNRELFSRVEALQAETKELRKQQPFKRQGISKD